MKHTKITVFTIGHSTHPIEQFIKCCNTMQLPIALIDIRTITKSRHNPQFNQTELTKSLKAAHIEYTHLTQLGGFRHTTSNSINTGWHNKSFRGFADYMQNR